MKKKKNSYENGLKFMRYVHFFFQKIKILKNKKKTKISNYNLIIIIIIIIFFNASIHWFNQTR